MNEFEETMAAFERTMAEYDRVYSEYEAEMAAYHRLLEAKPDDDTTDSRVAVNPASRAATGAD